MEEYIVELRNITKRFPGVVALRNMSVQIHAGEIHGLIGENGAGKSTLIKVLTGVIRADEGAILVDGEKVSLNNPMDAKKLGVTCVYQELNIVEELSITDNIFMGQVVKKKNGFLDYEYMNKKAYELMVSLGQEVDPTKPSGNYGMGVLQMIEIARALFLGAKLIIMDEPTSSLGENEVSQLMNTIRELKKNGVTILFVSHKLEELFEICDRVTIIRDGEHISTEKIDNLDNDKLISAMVGRSLSNLFPKQECDIGEEMFRVEGINSAGLLHDISFSVRKGEILAFSGLVGSGRTETFRAIYGADKYESGDIFIRGQKVDIRSPYDAIENKIAFLTEDRKDQGLVLSLSIKTNLVLANLKKYKKRLFINDKEIDKVCEENIEVLKIKTPTVDETVDKLSGGNQQKVVIGKWLNTEADIYIFDEPTRGIDVGAKIEVYNIMNQLVKDGKCVIMISSELPEILGMSDRVIVMREGRIMANIERESVFFNQEDIMKAAWGGKLS